MSSLSCQVFGKLISGDAEPTPEQEEKALLSSPEGEEKVYNVFICILKIFISLFHFLTFIQWNNPRIAMYFSGCVVPVSTQLIFFTLIRKEDEGTVRRNSLFVHVCPS